MKNINRILIFGIILIITSCQNNEVVDSQIPVIELKGPSKIYLQTGSVYDEPGFSAYDKRDGNLTDRVSVDIRELDTNNANEYLIFYDVYDLHGNKAETVYRTIVVKDYFGPVLSVQGENPLILDVGSDYNEPGFSAIDLSGVDITGNVIVNTDLDTNKPGTYYLEYIISDLQGNSCSLNRVVHVVYPNIPVITLKGKGVTSSDPWFVELSDLNFTQKDPGWAAFDRQNGDLSRYVNIDYNSLVPAVDGGGDGINTLGGSFEVLYTVNDFDGNNSETVIRYVEIVDDATPPDVLLNGKSFIELEIGTDSYVENSITAVDNSGTAFIYQDPPHFIENTIGEFLVKYWAEDPSGNKSKEIIRVVKFIDTTEPVMITSNVVLEYGAAFNYVPEVSDNDPEFTAMVGIVSSISETVDTRFVGDYQVTYRAADNCNNSVQKGIIVTVLPPTAPVISNSGFENHSSAVSGWSWIGVQAAVHLGWDPVIWGPTRTGLGPFNYVDAGIQNGGDPDQFDEYFATVVSHDGDNAAMLLGFQEVYSSVPVSRYSHARGILRKSSLYVYKDVVYSFSGKIKFIKQDDNEPDVTDVFRVLSESIQFYSPAGSSTPISNIEETHDDKTGVWKNYTIEITPDSDGYVSVEFEKFGSKGTFILTDVNQVTRVGRSFYDDLESSIIEYPMK